MLWKMLPPYCKYAGVGLMLLSLGLCTGTLLYTQSDIHQHQQLADICTVIALMGFLVIIRSREHDEDERTAAVRARALASAFVATIAACLLYKAQHLLFLPAAGSYTNSFASPAGLIAFGCCCYYFRFRYYLQRAE